MLRLSLIFIFAVFTFAQDQTLSIQGVLRQPSGKAVSDGNYSITFNFYNVLSGGAAIASKIESVDVKDGLYTANIDISGIPFNEQYWVGVQIGSDNELTPRAKLTAAPYALSLRGLTNKFPSTGTVVAGDSLRVEGSIKVSGSLESDGNVLMKNNLNILGDLSVIGTNSITGETILSDTLRVSKGLKISGGNVDVVTGSYTMSNKRALDESADGANTQLVVNAMQDFSKVEIASPLSIMGESKFRILWANVIENGTLRSGSGVSVAANTSNSVYTVTFDESFSQVPAVIVTPIDGANLGVSAKVRFPADPTSAIYVELFNDLGNRKLMWGFSILVIGY